MTTSTAETQQTRSNFEIFLDTIIHKDFTAD